MPYMEKKSSSQTISNYIHYLQWFVKSPTRIRWKVGMEVLQKYHKVNEIHVSFHTVHTDEEPFTTYSLRTVSFKHKKQ